MTRPQKDWRSDQHWGCEMLSCECDLSLQDAACTDSNQGIQLLQ